MVHKVIVQVGRQTKSQSQQKAIVTSDDCFSLKVHTCRVR